MEDRLAAEWAAYRKACEAVDLWRWNPILSDPAAEPAKRRHMTERLTRLRRAAVAASEQLISKAEDDAELDPEWLAGLRDEHEELRRAAGL